MIIISNKPGQLGNSLIVYANLLAFCSEHHVRLANPSFTEYRRYFESTSYIGSLFDRFLYSLAYVTARVLVALPLKTRFAGAIHLDWDEAYDLDACDRRILASHLLFIQGWRYRGNQTLKKHESQIRTFFRPREKYQARIDNFFSSKLTGTDQFLVGIHARRGDYKTFENGVYYYSLAQYTRVMLNIQELFSQKNVRFLICSNENIPSDVFDETGLDVTFAPHHELLDMYCLAKCEVIAGPPSTYTMWASYYGKVPLYMIRQPERAISFADFMVQEEF